MVKILHFLLKNTIFEDLLKDLHVNILYIEEGHITGDAVAHVKPKCLFLANSVEFGWKIYEKVKPDVIILNVPFSSAETFVNQLASAPVKIIIIMDEMEASSIIRLLSLGIQHFVLPPITPQAVLKAIHRSLYQFSLEKEILMQKDMLRTLLEFHNDLLCIIEDDQVIDCNMEFLDFFGFEDIESYQDHTSLFVNHFLDEVGYYSPSNNATWIEDCLLHSRKIKMKNKEGVEFVFLLRVRTFPDDGFRFVVLCTDMTELEREYKEKERLLTIDSLTNVYNRFKFQTVLTEEWERASYSRRVFSVIIFDIDNFKQVNDIYGYDYGDIALIQLTELIGKHLRQQDILARWDGDRFVLLLPNTTGKEAFQLAESLRFFIQTKKFTGLSQLTASFGVVQYEVGISWTTLIQNADAALNKAKQDGKNQVYLYRKEKYK
ncbi:diguanylate cyclase domain-containing protein [Microbacteriaceae bacterium 4G12]